MLHATRAGRWVDTSEFPLSLGLYVTIPKSRHDKAIGRCPYKYLDKVHVDIGFGDTVAIGGS